MFLGSLSYGKMSLHNYISDSISFCQQKCAWFSKDCSEIATNSSYSTGKRWRRGCLESVWNQVSFTWVLFIYHSNFSSDFQEKHKVSVDAGFQSVILYLFFSFFFFYCTGNQSFAQIAHRGCGISILGAL